MTTIEEAKQFLRENWGGKIVLCPCCKQSVKLYERKITSSMAYGLILLYRYFRLSPHNAYVHIENYFKELKIASSIRGDMVKLKYWGLIERSFGIRSDGSFRNGYYRITEKGTQFVLGGFQVPRCVKLFNNKFYGFSEEMTTIKEALGDKFNYRELMNS